MATKKQINDFLKQIVPIAQAQAKKHNNQIFVSVCIAQACHESGWGTSAKMVNAKAVFGIKVGKSAYKFGKAWKGAAYKTGTTEYYDGKNATKIVDWFRAYDSLEDSTEDYFDMLCHCNRYKPALNCATPEDCIRAIVKGGYATGPAYAEHIIELINLYNLKQYDNTSAQATGYISGKTYTLSVNLYVRDTANGNKVLFDKLTDDGKRHAFVDENGFGILRNGTKVTCKDSKFVGNAIWIQIPSGWVCAKTTNGVVYIS